MYEEFFGLETKPFRMTPDPEFLFQSRDHREALAVLRYAVMDNQGFAVLVGEVGTGKTLLLHSLLSSLPGGVEAAYLFCPRMDFRDLLRYLLAEFHVDAGEGKSEGELLMLLNDYLTGRLAEGKQTLLIIDEAQNMDEALLESIRMLSNLETSESKLLQMILAGQPELESKLSLPEMRQLRQRVSLRAVINPLGRAETEEYIRFRMEVAGYEGEIPFTRPALDLIHEYSRGLPRTINVVADNALLIGYATDETEIGRNIVSEAVRDLERESAAPVTASAGSSIRRNGLIVAGAVVSLAAAAVLVSGFRPPWRESAPAEPRHASIDAGILAGARIAEQLPRDSARQEEESMDGLPPADKPTEPAWGLESPGDAMDGGLVSEEVPYEGLPRTEVETSPKRNGESAEPAPNVPHLADVSPPQEPEPERVSSAFTSPAKPALSAVRPLSGAIRAPRSLPAPDAEPVRAVDAPPGLVSSGAAGGDGPKAVERKPLSPVNIPLIFAPPARSPAKPEEGSQ